MSIPLEVILGPLGAVAVLLWWNHELRKENSDLKRELKGWVDDMRTAIRKSDSK